MGLRRVHFGRRQQRIIGARLANANALLQIIQSLTQENNKILRHVQFPLGGQNAVIGFRHVKKQKLLGEHPFKVLFDYGHNAHAVGMLADLAARLEVKGRRIVVLAGPGDRRDEDLVAIAEAVAGRFDHYVCRRDDDVRGRADDEVPRLQAAALQARGVPEAAITIIPDEQQAIDAALRMGREGDLLLVFADALVRSWKQVTKFRAEGATYSSLAGDGEESSGRALRVSASDGVEAPAPPPAAPQRSAAGVAGRGLADGGPVAPAVNLDGLIRDERGVRIAPEAED